MSDPLQMQGLSGVGAVSGPSQVTPVVANGLAEIRAYGMRAVGPSVVPPTSSQPSSLAALDSGLRGFAGFSMPDSNAPSTRGMIGGTPQPIPTTAEWGTPPPVPSGGFTPPPPAPAPMSGLLPSPSRTPPPAAPSSDEDDREPFPKTDYSPWRDWTPEKFLDFHDDRPVDTWAPNANRSEAFAALDNMKLTSPEDALAQWRAQKAAAAPPPAPEAPPAVSLPPAGPDPLGIGTHRYVNPNIGTKQPMGLIPPAVSVAALPPQEAPPAPQMLTRPVTGDVQSYRTQFNNMTYQPPTSPLGNMVYQPPTSQLSAPPSIAIQSLGLGSLLSNQPSQPPLGPNSMVMSNMLVGLPMLMSPQAVDSATGSLYATSASEGLVHRVTAGRATTSQYTLDQLNGLGY
ncbi:MAG: hypothetical protein ACYCW6_02270 [Candidatus Xenobia bacterium]